MEHELDSSFKDILMSKWTWEREERECRGRMKVLCFTEPKLTFCVSHHTQSLERLSPRKGEEEMWWQHSFCAMQSLTLEAWRGGETTLKSHFKAARRWRQPRAASSHWFFKDTKTLLWFRFTMNKKKRIVQTKPTMRVFQIIDFFFLLSLPSAFFLLCSALFFRLFSSVDSSLMSSNRKKIISFKVETRCSPLELRTL